MERRFEERRRQLLEQAELGPEVTQGMLERLREFAEPFAGSLPGRESREHGQVYLAGLLSDLERKNVESIAYRHDLDRGNLQRFIGWSPWDHQPLLRELSRQVGSAVGEADGVIVFDPSGHAKCGRDSVGVQRQWLGRLGKVDNGQVGVYMGYASGREHALVDVRLYLPNEWAADPSRRRKCGVPKSIRYQTRHDLALEMLGDSGRHLPHAWVAGDDEMGRSRRFRKELRDLGERYLLAVPSNTNVRDLAGAVPAYAGRGPRAKPPFVRADEWVAGLSPDAWSRIDVRDGEKGPLVMAITKTRVVARTECCRQGATEELLVVTRSVDEKGHLKTDYYLSNAEADTPLAEFARVAKAEHRVEDAIKRAKSQACFVVGVRKCTPRR